MLKAARKEQWQIYETTSKIRLRDGILYFRHCLLVKAIMMGKPEVTEKWRESYVIKIILSTIFLVVFMVAFVTSHIHKNTSILCQNAFEFY
jgi:hypothetical protein